jgi:hypothetical protein
VHSGAVTYCMGDVESSTSAVSDWVALGGFVFPKYPLGIEWKQSALALSRKHISLGEGHFSCRTI